MAQYWRTQLRYATRGFASAATNHTRRTGGTIRLDSRAKPAERHGYVAEGLRPTRRIELFPEHGRERSLTNDELVRLGGALRVAATRGLPPDAKRRGYQERRHGKRKASAPRLTPAHSYAIAATQISSAAYSSLQIVLARWTA